MLLSICSEPKVLEVMRIVNIVIQIIRIVIPILLILFCMIDGVRATMSGDLEPLKKSIVARCIAAILIFFIPMFVSVIVNSTTANYDYKNCLVIRTRSQINAIYNTREEEYVSKAETSKNMNDYNTAIIYLNNIKDQEKYKEFQERLRKVKEEIDAARQQDSGGDSGGSGVFEPDPGDPVKCSTTAQYSKCSPKKGVFGSFSYYDAKPDSTDDRWSMKMNPAWQRANLVSITKTCSNGWVLDFQMHRLAKTTWEKVLDRFCQITTTGIDGYKYEPSDFEFSGKKASHVARFVSGTKSPSLHSWGIAIDINPSTKYTVNGKTYVPYGRNKDTYENFVKALGREDDPRNVNYIVWKKIFEPLGFKWGGDWGRNGHSGTYDGMHYEINWR